jgi:TM2 domain-containing membrane protein YozV
MVICPDCGKDVPESKFCKNCGAYIKDVKPIEKIDVIGFCSDCGSEIEAGNKFCPNCGASISHVDEAEPVEEIEVVDQVPVEETDDEISVESDNLDASDSGPVVIEQDDDLKDSSSVPVPVEQDDDEISLKPNDSEDGAGQKIKFCFNCGNRLIGDFKFCPECGQDLSDDAVSSKPVTSSGDKNIILAIILSAFLPGLGQIYLGLDHKGAIFLIAYVISAILILILIGFLLCIVIWIWALVDTIISTNAINRGDEVKDKIL